MSEKDNVITDKLFRLASIDLLDACLDILGEISEEPCAVCGDTGYTLPCLKCDKLLCPEHRDDSDFCVDCAKWWLLQESI